MKWILNKLGYIHESQMTYVYHMGEVAKYLGDPTEYGYTKKQEQQFMKDLAAIDGVNAFLDATLAADMQREFSSQEDSFRQLVKGSFGRTIYFKKGVKEALDLIKV